MSPALRLLTILTFVWMGLTPTKAEAYTYTFSYCLENNSGLCETVASQLKVEVTESSEDGWVNFTFTNDVGIQSSVTDLYFDADGYFSTMKIVGESAGVDFRAARTRERTANERSWLSLILWLIPSARSSPRETTAASPACARSCVWRSPFRTHRPGTNAS